MLSHGAWQRRFGGRPEVLGRQIVLHGNGVAYTIVGVMPRAFDYPKGADFWVPIIPATTAPGVDTAVANVNIVGRLRAGVTSGNAADELTAFFNRPESSPWQRSMIGVATPLPRLLLGETRPAVLAFALAPILLLIIGVGLVIGLLVALSVNRLLAALLYGVTPPDPLTMAVVAIALLIIATSASLLPAHSVTRIDPATALRAEG